MLGGVYLFLVIMGFCIDVVGFKIFIFYLILIIYLMVSELYFKKKNLVLNWVYFMLSQMYIVFFFVMLNVFVFQNDLEVSSVLYNLILFLFIFVFLWLNDMGVYCFGLFFGKYCLFECILFKKLWEGFIGGGIVVIVFLFVFVCYFFIMIWVEWVGLVLVVVIFGIWGDLIEFLLKC